ncbi:MAG: hypothetical protein AB7O67_24040 [Vicinamibacterales bacterium]
MSATSSGIIAAAKDKAQDTGSVPLLVGPNAYTGAMATARRLFDGHRPNRRIVHYTVATASFRFVLYGEGAILSGADAWAQDASSLFEVWLPYDTAARYQEPLDESLWRIIDEPGLVVLELLEQTAAVDDVLRLVYTSPHTISADDESATTIRSADVDAFETLLASVICETAAARYAQNTGTTNLSGDVVDRRSQADVMGSRAKALRTLYNQMIGVGQEAGGSTPAASAVKDLDVDTSHRGGMLWHSRLAR